MKYLYVLGLACALQTSHSNMQEAPLSDTQRLLLGLGQCLSDARRRQEEAYRLAVLDGTLSPAEIFQIFQDLDPENPDNYTAECLAIRQELDAIGHEYLTAEQQQESEIVICVDGGCLYVHIRGR